MNNKKFQDFGAQLKKIRLNASKTISDVSGAIELPEDKLKQIEKGESRPAEELIFLLANYFDLSFTKTQHLLRLAGYSKKITNSVEAEFKSLFNNLPANKSDEPQILLAITDLKDDRAVYTNETRVNVSSSGVVIEFLQCASVNRNNRPKTVSKIGMSVEHAYRLRDILNHALADLRSQKDNPVDSDSSDQPDSR